MCLVEEIFHRNCHLSFFHNEKAFRITTDSVFLSEFVRIDETDKLLVDFGSGLAVIPLLLSTRSSIKMVGLEIDQDMVDLSKKSIVCNKLEHQISILNTKIQDVDKYFSSNSVDIIVSNPPYFKVDSNTNYNFQDPKIVSRHEITVTFEEIAKSASKILKNKGKFFLVHRIERSVEIFELLRKNHLEPKRMTIIYDNINKEPSLFLLEAVKGANPSLKMEKPYIRKE